MAKCLDDTPRVTFWMARYAVSYTPVEGRTLVRSAPLAEKAVDLDASSAGGRETARGGT
jgi:hypothetical protein